MALSRKKKSSKKTGKKDALQAIQHCSERNWDVGARPVGTGDRLLVDSASCRVTVSALLLPEWEIVPFETVITGEKCAAVPVEEDDDPCPL